MSNNVFICPECKVATHYNNKSYNTCSLSLGQYLLPYRELNNSYNLFIENFICGSCRKSFFNITVRSTWDNAVVSKVCFNIARSDSYKQFPDYIPETIREDYEEACKIKDLSPKSSATLARRALQGMIRDFWGISGKSLYDEINQIKDKVDSDTFDAIDAVRKIGNIGAHMEKDVNVIIDIEPSEAELLINLIEELIEDWYIAREQRRVRNEKLQQKADEIKQLKQTNGQNSTVN